MSKFLSFLKKKEVLEGDVPLSPPPSPKAKSETTTKSVKQIKRRKRDRLKKKVSEMMILDDNGGKKQQQLSGVEDEDILDSMDANGNSMDPKDTGSSEGKSGSVDGDSLRDVDSICDDEKDVIAKALNGDAEEDCLLDDAMDEAFEDLEEVASSESCSQAKEEKEEQLVQSVPSIESRLLCDPPSECFDSAGEEFFTATYGDSTKAEDYQDFEEETGSVDIKDVNDAINSTMVGCEHDQSNEEINHQDELDKPLAIGITTSDVDRQRIDSPNSLTSEKDSIKTVDGIDQLASSTPCKGQQPDVPSSTAVDPEQVEKTNCTDVPDYIQIASDITVKEDLESEVINANQELETSHCSSEEAVKVDKNTCSSIVLVNDSEDSLKSDANRELEQKISESRKRLDHGDTSDILEVSLNSPSLSGGVESSVVVTNGCDNPLGETSDSVCQNNVDTDGEEPSELEVSQASSSSGSRSRNTSRCLDRSVSVEDELTKFEVSQEGQEVRFLFVCTVFFFSEVFGPYEFKVGSLPLYFSDCLGLNCCTFLQAEARLAQKRAARAEARELRLKELEKQQKENPDNNGDDASDMSGEG